MQKAIVISRNQYDRMVASYDEAMEELVKLRVQLSELKEVVDHSMGSADKSTSWAE